jgi:hypothetical protein
VSDDALDWLISELRRAYRMAEQIACMKGTEMHDHEIRHAIAEAIHGEIDR